MVDECISEMTKHAKAQLKLENEAAQKLQSGSIVTLKHDNRDVKIASATNDPRQIDGLPTSCSHSAQHVNIRRGASDQQQDSSSPKFRFMDGALSRES